MQFDEFGQDVIVKSILNRGWQIYASNFSTHGHGHLFKKLGKKQRRGGWHLTSSWQEEYWLCVKVTFQVQLTWKPLWLWGDFLLQSEAKTFWQFCPIYAWVNLHGNEKRFGCNSIGKQTNKATILCHLKGKQKTSLLFFA